jgi:hypothetical protein
MVDEPILAIARSHRQNRKLPSSLPGAAEWPAIRPLLAGIHRRRRWKSGAGSLHFDVVWLGRPLMVRYQELRAQHETHEDDVYPPWSGLQYRSSAIFLLLAAAEPRRSRKQRNQASSNRAGVRIRGGSVRQSANQRCQFFGRGLPRQLSQFGSLLPGIHVRSRQSGKHAYQHAVLVLADRREQEIIKFRSRDRHWCGWHLIIDCGRPTEQDV